MTKCFYHSADLDGHCSGAVVAYALQDPELELIGINYGELFPWETISAGEPVIMVDFSLQPFADMVRLNDLATLTWIDHHKSAILDWEEHNRPVRRAVLNTEKAACELAWQYYFPKHLLPLSVFWLGRYDIWKHQEHPGALEFQYGMRLYETRPDNQSFWTDLFERNSNAAAIRIQGEAILNYETQQNRKFAAAFAFETELDGLRCIAVNKGMTNRLVFDSVYDPSKHDAMLSFCWRGGQWTVSLYSTKPEVDVSVICKARGGGGHKGASGFQCQELPFPLS